MTNNDAFDLTLEEAPLSQQAQAQSFAAPDWLQGLNKVQCEAIKAGDGPLLILAGAGTGKTRVLTSRIAWLIGQGKLWPSQCLAVTFTNKAAREMRERVERLLGNRTDAMPWLGTFHSICAKILRTHAELAGLKSNFTILDKDDQLRLAKQVIENANIDEKRWPARLLAPMIDGWKNQALTPAELTHEQAGSFANGKGKDLYKAYEAQLKLMNAADFGSLLLECYLLFKKHKDICEEYQNHFTHLFVDEYQDTNVVQYLWLKLLCAKHHNLCCVGDDDQSIYGWRGAEVENILRFQKDFANANIIRLEQNYRSSKHILAAAAGLISHNKKRLGKTLWTEQKGGDKVRLYGFFDGKAEARIFSEEIETLQLRKVNLDEIAILVRAGHQMRAFEDRLIEMGLPYRVVGGPRFYERAEIRDANAYLRLIAQSQDNLAFERILNKPKRGFGKVSLGKLHELAREEHCTLMDASKIAVKKKILSPQAGKSLATFLKNIEEWKQMAENTMISELCETVLKQSGYIDMWKKDKAPNAPGKVDNLYELIRSMNDFETLQSYLEHVSLVLDIEQQDNGKGRVSLMTLHAAKGLEFEYVFLPGWERGIFPHQRALKKNLAVALEEERRLAYVGITRAKKRASLSFAGNRQIHGNWSSQLPSQFIDELPKPHIAIMSQVKREEPKPYQSNPKTDTYSRRSKYHKGDLVRHHKFGTGRIEHVEGKSLTIMFENIGRKKIIDNFVQKA